MISILLALFGVFAMAGIAGASSSSSPSADTLQSKKSVKPEENNGKDKDTDTSNNDPIPPVTNDPPVVADDEPEAQEPDTGTEDTPTTGGGEDTPTQGGSGNTSTDNTPDEPANPTPIGTEQVTETSHGGSVTPTDATASFSVAGGRVTTLQVADHESVESIRILEGPEEGNLTVNPDNTLALVMSGSDHTGALNISYEVTHTDGSATTHNNTVNVLTSTQDAGWGQGNFYMLETDENGDVIVEHGDNHRDVHISGSNDALGLSDIAALEGLSANDITTNWLQDHPEYGASPDMALDTEAGMRLWDGMTGTGSEPSSDWLLFESGYEYDNLGGIINVGTAGEDPLHPIHITSYGEGAKPILNTSVSLSPYEAPWATPNENIVISDISVTGGIVALSGSNLLIDNVDITNDTVTPYNLLGLNVGNATGFTLYNSSITDVYRDVHPEGADYWPEGGLLTAGGYISSTDGLLIEGNLFDQNGWAPDYEYDRSTDGGQSPTMFNHNLYLQYNTTDVTLRDNIVMQGASYGVHVRGGGFVEDNVFLDNNVAVDFLGGDYRDYGHIGNFTLAADNLITSGAHKDIDGFVGGRAMGAANDGQETTFLDNIITHMADPNNPDEIAEKGATEYALDNRDAPFYDDTIIYNWSGSGGSQHENSDDKNTDNLDTSILDATTIQKFTQELLGDDDATIADLADFLRAQADGSLDHYVDSDLIIDFFQTGFGLSVEDRITPEELRFVPSDLGDGVRWDNRLNWSTDDLPGAIAGDSVDLGGNWVNYGGTTTIENLDFGSGGKLAVSHGKLTIEGDTNVGENGGELNISNAGQVWMNGYDDPDQLEINVDGGRFVNTDHMDGNTELNITDGQTVLATDGAAYDVANGSKINIDGSDAKVGFDDEDGDTAVLRLEEGGTLNFIADENGFSTIEEFRTGAMGEDTDVASGVNLGLGSVEIDVTELGGDTGTFELLSVDEIIGELSDIKLVGLAGNRDAHLTIDYATDTVSLQLSDGDGNITLGTEGAETDMDSASADASDLWTALTEGQGTYSDNQPTELYDEDELVGEMAA